MSVPLASSPHSGTDWEWCLRHRHSDGVQSPAAAAIGQFCSASSGPPRSDPRHIDNDSGVLDAFKEHR